MMLNWICGFGLLFFAPVIGVLWLVSCGICWLFTEKKKDPTIGKAIVESWGPDWRHEATTEREGLEKDSDA